MSWQDAVAAIEGFEDIPLDPTLLAAFEAEARERPLAPLRFYTPTFRAY